MAAMGAKRTLDRTASKYLWRVSAGHMGHRHHPERLCARIRLAGHYSRNVILKFLTKNISAFIPECGAPRVIDEVHQERFPTSPQSVGQMLLTPLVECVLRVRHKGHEGANELHLLGGCQRTEVCETLGRRCKRALIPGKGEVPAGVIVMHRLRRRGPDSFGIATNLQSYENQSRQTADHADDLTPGYKCLKNQNSVQCASGA